MSENQQLSKELETIKEDESSASASSASIVEDAPTTTTAAATALTTTAAAKKQSNKMASHMIIAGSGSGGGGGVGLQTPTVDNIIEEEEEEEDEDEKKKETTQIGKKDTETVEKTNSATTEAASTSNEESSKMTEPASTTTTTTTTTTSSSSSSQSHPPVTFLNNKFVLETVHLDEQGQPITPVAGAAAAAAAPTTTASSSEATTTEAATTVADGGGVAPSRKSTSSTGDEEVVEIKVEEGYATRQMDEYFRQTIAAIKEELHRKLESKEGDQTTAAAVTEKQAADHHHHHRSKKRTATSDGFDDEDDLEGGDKVELKPTGGQTKDDYYCTNCRDSLTRPKNNRAFIYQSLMGKDKSSSSPSALKRDKVTPILVLIGSIVNQFIIEGVCFNYANLFEFIQREFHFSSKLIATLPGALLLAFFLLLAPMSIFLSKQFGTRRIAVLGTFISTLSLLICSFFNNFVIFVIFYGIFTGVGLSLIYVPSVLAISKWFMRKRLLANSLTQLGACVGAAIYPICSELLLRRYKLFDTLLILAGVQFNCLIGAVLIRDDDSSSTTTTMSSPNIPASKISYSTSSALPPSQQACCRGAQDAALRRSSKLRATSASKKSSSSAALLIENEHNHSGVVTSPTTPPPPTSGMRAKAKIKRGYGSGAYHFHHNYLDASETDSTFSVSTTTAPNYTLKQYWRKFIQTRKSTSNAKKNLFHLIAEEKRKTRTLSKTSLEDGFVITTSNNLLAPNDDSHVIVSRRQKLQQNEKNSINPEVTSISATSRASKFFSRIANSLRSLATHASTASTSAVAANHPAKELASHPSTDNSTAPVGAHPPPLDSSKHNTTHVQEVNERSPPATIPLMSVFDGPITTSPPSTTTTTTAAAAATTHQEGSGEQTGNGVGKVVGNDSPPISDGEEDSIGGGDDVMQDEDEEEEIDEAVDERDEDEGSMDGEEEDEDDDDEEDEDSAESASARVHRHSSQITAALKNQRYLTYRASLANSVRGSLMECSVPEEKRRKSGGDPDEEEAATAQPKETDEATSNVDDTNSIVEQRRRARKARTSSFVAARQQQNKLTTPTPINSTAYATNIHAVSTGASGTRTNRVNIQTENEETVGYAKPTIHNLRRFISTMETASFYNVPVNLEPIEYNLKNSLTKCFAENYRRQHKNMRKSVYQKKYNLILYLDYLSYLTSFKLFLNPILFVLNASFCLHSAALGAVLVHVSEFATRRTLTRPQSIHVLALIGFMCGVGRLVSTVAYKVNASNVKSRIFAYVLTVLLTGIAVLSSTLLCDTFFSFCMFAITFGTLTGFNLNLRTVMIYDMMALEWSDDSLFCFTLFSQAVGVLIGLPLASLLFDIFNDDTFVFYYAGALFILSALLLTPGRKIRSYSYSSYKSLNKFYLQRRFN